MGRSRNDEERMRIRDIAFNLFRKNGYDNTSINDIAKSADTKKSMVQYYFPKKENLIDMYMDKLLYSASQLVKRSDESRDPLEQVYLTGYLIFLFLYLDNQKEILTKTILQDRRNTMTFIDYVTKWSVRYIGSDDPEFNRKLEDSITFAAGGGCEYVFHVITKKIDADPYDIVEKVLSEMNLLMGVPSAHVNVKDFASPEWVEENCRELTKIMYHGKSIKPASPKSDFKIADAPKEML